MLIHACSAVLLLSVPFAPQARADDQPCEGRVAAGAKFAAGAAVAFAAHEAGHLALDAAFGAAPYFKKVEFGGVPFFAVAHHPVSPRREFAISSAGFWVQHATDEWLLSSRGPIGRAGQPACRGSSEPACRPGAFVKGMFAFNVLTSVGYSMAAFAEAGPYERDTRGMASGARVNERLIGAAILAPALLDWYRYYHPRSRTAAWLSRAVKAAGVVAAAK